MVRYVCVILPLKLGWEPFYSTDIEEITVGSRVRVDFAKGSYVAVVSEVDVSPNIDVADIKEIRQWEKELARISPMEIEFWRRVANYYMCSVGEVFKAAYSNSLLSRELVKASSKARERLRVIVESGVSEGLTDAQERALNGIKAGFENGKVVLLRGVTGSGKTEVYMKLAQEVVNSGKGVLFLVPEIALSRQLEDRVRAVFPDLVTFHSGESVVHRREVMAVVRETNGYIVLGTRSSIFLPHHNLGLVIVDEEDDISYKQESPAPRYNGREAAIMLGNLHNAMVLLGSATPSLESIYNCDIGRYASVELNERFYGAESPEVEIIDIIAERRKNGMVKSFSKKLIARINDTLAGGGQVMVMHSRRAYSHFVQCTDCGHIPKCPHCNVTLSYHIAGKLVCHYCGYTDWSINKCKECGGELKPMGAGTQRIEEEAKELFPNALIARIDSDNAHSAGYSKSVITKFAKGELNFLIGTQIVAKGFDFSGLSLVAVLNGDLMLGLEDFRADEKAVRLLEQFKGRCGRREKRGTFVIQTYQPAHPVYGFLFSGNLKSLFSERLNFGYPPFSRLIHIILKDKNEGRLYKLSLLLGKRLMEFGERSNGSVKITGPYPPVIEKISDEYIKQIRIVLKKDKNLIINKKYIADTVMAFEKEMRYSGHIVIDVDPV